MRSWLVTVSLVIASLGSASLAAGCWSERAPAETTPARSLASEERPPAPWPARARPGGLRRQDDRCARVIAHVLELARIDASMSGLAPAMLDDLQQAGIEGCHETEWSDEILGCYEGATSMVQMGECYRVMTEEQRDDFERRFLDIRLRHRGAPPAPPPPPTP